nr:bifunctional hydroxymethylpyrimidine kinase/phosphomethylpyrimidine kinase [Kroppenstedtia eburnea]
MITTSSRIPRALTIAGSDSGGGAGIQADLKTFQELDVFGMSAITAVTIQNTLGVHGYHELEAKAVADQIDAVVEDLGVDALKTGMIANISIMEVIADRVKHHRLAPLVVDPVMVAKGGALLLEKSAQTTLVNTLIPLARLVTPNLPEAEVLTGMSLNTDEDRKEAARQIHDMGAEAVVIKGGHLEGEFSTDLLFDGESFHTFTSPRISTRHTHGTGCTFSAAVTAELAKGRPLSEAVSIAKEFVTRAIAHPLELGGGHGPTNHWAFRQHRTQTVISDSPRT